MASTNIINQSGAAFATQSTTHTQRTISSTAVALISGSLATSTKAVLVQFNNASARVTFDGSTDPTTSLGLLYTDGSTAYLSRKMALAAKCIRTASTDVVAEIQQLDYIVT
jgi:hypothetical protein